MSLTFGKTKYRLRVLYKSGNSHCFWVYDFSIDGGRWEWTAVDDDNKPIALGASEVEAVFQVGVIQNIWSLFKR